MTALLAAVLCTAGGSPPSVVECREFLKSLPNQEARSVSDEEGLARLFVSGAWEGEAASAALASAFRAEWRRVGDRWRLAQPAEARKRAERQVRELRERAWAEALSALQESVDPYRKGSPAESAQGYSKSVEDYATRYGSPGAPESVTAHPMKTLLVGLLEKVGTGVLAEIEPGQRRHFTTLDLPGTTVLKDVSKVLSWFDRSSAATADLLANEASAGHLAKLHEMNWLFGSRANWSPTLAVTLTVVGMADGARAGVTIDRGMPLPDGYSEPVPLDLGRSPLSELLATAEDRALPIDWSPAAKSRYPSLDPAGGAGAFDLGAVRFPESLAVGCVFAKLADVLDRPVLALLPPGLEAVASASLRANTSLGEALDTLGKGHFGLEALEIEGGILLRPRNAKLGRLGRASVLATESFVKDGQRNGATASDDWARYVAGLDGRSWGNPEPGWWRTGLIRQGIAYRDFDAVQASYVFFGRLLALAGPDGSLRTRLAVLPATMKAAAWDFALSDTAKKGREPSSLQTVENAAEADWSRAEVVLERREVAAALWHVSTVKSLLDAKALARIVEAWEPAAGETSDPKRIRLQEGVCPEYEVTLVLSPRLKVQRTFLGKLDGAGESVRGTAALSESFRAVIERERAQIRAEGG